MKRLLTLLIVAVIGLAFVAVPGAMAQDDGDDGEMNGDGATAYVRAAHFAPDAGEVDVYVNGEATDWTGVAYEGVSDWMAVPAGDIEVSLVPAGGAMDDALLEPQTVTLSADSWYTLIAAGTEDGSAVLAPVEESMAPMRPGVSRVTYVNALTGTTEVNFNRDDVVFISQLAPLGSASDVASTSDVEMDSDTYTYTVNATQDPDQVYGQVEDYDFNESSVYLMVVAGSEDDAGLYVSETPRAEYQMLIGELEEPGTIVEAAQAHDLLAPFAEAIETANLTDLLSGEGPYTVFAPYDGAMQQVLDEYEGDAEGLESYLRDRIVEGKLQSQDVFENDSLTAISGNTIDVTGEGDSVFVNGAEILNVNVPATNGTIHIVGEQPAE